MTACETCWTAASHKSLMGLGATADLYKLELEAHPEHGDCQHESVDSRALPNGALRQTCNDCGLSCDTERAD